MSNCISSVFVFVYLHYNIGIYLRAECESWTIKNWAPKNWCFQNVILKKTLEIPLNIKEIKTVNPKGNQPWIFIGRTDAEAEALILFGHLCKEPTHCKKRSWCWERLKAGGEGNNRGWDGWMASPTLWTWVWAKPWEMGKDREAWRAAVQGVTKSRTWLSDWTTTTNYHPTIYLNSVSRMCHWHSCLHNIPHLTTFKVLWGLFPTYSNML